MVDFHYVDVGFELADENKYALWIQSICEEHKVGTYEFTYIFCSDQHLLSINQKHLNHDFYTDIITFPLLDDPLSADIFISIERVRENATKYSQLFDNELLRVMSHGILHLIGHKDKEEKDILMMRKAEDDCIQMFDQI